MEFYNLLSSFEQDQKADSRPNPDKMMSKLLRDAQHQFPEKRARGYYRQIDNTGYCSALAIVNAAIFYGHPIDIHGKHAKLWEQFLEDSGSIMLEMHGSEDGSEGTISFHPPLWSFDTCAAFFGLVHFPVMCTLEKVKDQIFMGRPLILDVVVGGSTHRVLVINIKGDTLTCVNYHWDQARTVQGVKWKDLRFPTKSGKPSPLISLGVLVPETELSPELVEEINDENLERLNAVFFEGQRQGRRQAKRP